MYIITSQDSLKVAELPHSLGWPWAERPFGPKGPNTGTAAQRCGHGGLGAQNGAYAHVLLDLRHTWEWYSQGNNVDFST